MLQRSRPALLRRERMNQRRRAWSLSPRAINQFRGSNGFVFSARNAARISAFQNLNLPSFEPPKVCLPRDTKKRDYQRPALDVRSGEKRKTSRATMSCGALDKEKKMTPRNPPSRFLPPGQSSPRKAARSRRAALPKQPRGSESSAARGEGVWGGAEKKN